MHIIITEDDIRGYDWLWFTGDNFGAKSYRNFKLVEQGKELDERFYIKDNSEYSGFFSSRQWRIQDFPRGEGAPTSKVGVLTYFFGRKLHENERIRSPRGGTSLAPPLDPPLVGIHLQILTCFPDCKPQWQQPLINARIIFFQNISLWSWMMT